MFKLICSVIFYDKVKAVLYVIYMYIHLYTKKNNIVQCYYVNLKIIKLRDAQRCSLELKLIHVCFNKIYLALKKKEREEQGNKSMLRIHERDRESLWHFQTSLLPPGSSNIIKIAWEFSKCHNISSSDVLTLKYKDLLLKRCWEIHTER